MLQAIWSCESQLDFIKRGFPWKYFLQKGQFHWKTVSKEMTFTQYRDFWHTFSQQISAILVYPEQSYKATIAPDAKRRFVSDANSVMLRYHLAITAIREISTT